MTVLRRLATVGAAVIFLSLSVTVSSADATRYAPSSGSVFTGVTADPVSSYTAYVHKHPAVYQEFVAWGQYLPTITADAIMNRSRMMMSITTAFGSTNVVTPLAIAAGAGDSWLIGLGAQIAASGNVTYVRLMSEMDNAANPYCAFNTNGSSRGAAYSAWNYKQAWRRATLILRGGSVVTINARLHAIGLPPLQTGLSWLATGKVAMAWVPMVAGSPDIAANLPRDYFPGKAYVDWVGTDFYSRYPNFSGLTKFYRAYAGYPFVFGEYAFWYANSTRWVNQLFRWIGARSRVGMVVYNDSGNVFHLQNYSASRTLASRLSARRYLAWTPEWLP